MRRESFYQNSVIVTGASSGIGRELALQLGEQGALLVLAARSTDELDRVAALCRERGGKAVRSNGCTFKCKNKYGRAG